jgi:hypothetical protein
MGTIGNGNGRVQAAETVEGMEQAEKQEACRNGVRPCRMGDGRDELPLGQARCIQAIQAEEAVSGRKQSAVVDVAPTSRMRTNHFQWIVSSRLIVTRNTKFRRGRVAVDLRLPAFWRIVSIVCCPRGKTKAYLYFSVRTQWRYWRNAASRKSATLTFEPPTSIAIDKRPGETLRTLTRLQCGSRRR